MLINKMHDINYKDSLGRNLVNIFIKEMYPNLRIIKYLIEKVSMSIIVIEIILR